MQILQLDVDNVRYELVEPEIKVHEEMTERSESINDAVVLLVSVEKGDDEGTAKKAVEEAAGFMSALKRTKMLIYPFAHLSMNLEEPEKALGILRIMRARAKELGLELYSAPFGWNKRFGYYTKGHPLAEQSRRYGPDGVAAGPAEKHSVQRNQEPETEESLLARVRKSDFSSLPETDHRIIGERLDLFSFQEPSPGMVYWHSKGLVVWDQLKAFIRSELKARGYIEISTPALANVTLWKVSGHWDHYRNDMFLTKLRDEEFGLKPMNCPSTFLVYKSRKWSYKELPVRIAIFDTLYRNELSGVASGLFRVKALTQDDAHLFVTEEQIGKEIESILDLMKKLYNVFGLNEKMIKLSTMPDSHVGTKEDWDHATDVLKEAITKAGLNFEIKEKEGAFYGPKIDVDVKDSMGRWWQCATIQVDFQMPKRFRLSYTADDGTEKTPIVIHRAIYGSLERFIGIITEHYQGSFPAWMSPVQAVVIPISDQAREYAGLVNDRLSAAGIRSEFDSSDKTMQYKIREAQLQKIPYMIVVGSREAEAGTISVRTRNGTQKHGLKVEEFISAVSAEIKANSDKLSY